MIEAIIRDIIEYFGQDVKRINHALKVYDFAFLICKETNVDENTLLMTSVAALLHDVGIKEAERKYHSSAGKFQEIEGPQIAKKILLPYDLDKEFIERLCFIIGNHHTYSKIDRVDFQILVEADFLVNIFEESMSQEAIQKIRNEIFKTKSGIRLLEEMYLGPSDLPNRY
jgi:HD superfamily phosphodiesterase